MLNFIVCDDEEPIRKNIINIISKIMMPIENEYKTYEFNNYDKEFMYILNKQIGKKIYILDIEVKEKSGLNIAKQIRENDWDSIIIILTVHYELTYEALKSRLMLLDFISKFNQYENKLKEVLTLALKIFNCGNILSFIFKHVDYKIPYSDILYIVKDSDSRKIIIRTFYNDYLSNMTLNEIEKKLNNDFCRTHRACIVNIKNVKSFDYSNRVITFKNNEKINLFSRTYKKEVQKVCT